jgi:hypothetical protein
LYWSINAVPHKVTAMVDGASQPDASVQGYRRSYYLRDEQGFNVTFAGGDAIVYGGGVIHAVNQVLQAGDLYPSVTAVLTRNPDSFSFITNLISDADDLLAPYNISIVSMFETKPGSIALPVNSVCSRRGDVQSACLLFVHSSCCSADVIAICAYIQRIHFHSGMDQFWRQRHQSKPVAVRPADIYVSRLPGLNT